jgi:hypothetical protein
VEKVNLGAGFAQEAVGEGGKGGVKLARRPETNRVSTEREEEKEEVRGHPGPLRHHPSFIDCVNIS